MRGRLIAISVILDVRIMLAGLLMMLQDLVFNLQQLQTVQLLIFLEILKIQQLMETVFPLAQDPYMPLKLL